jgi:hypothetical protein
MLENILVALSNWVAIPAIKHAYLTGRTLEAFLLGGSALSSFLYHLSERSKHHMKGFKFLAPYESILLELDRVFAKLTILLFAYNYYEIPFVNNYILLFLIVGVIAGYISEHIPQSLNVQSHQWLFVISHSMWHNFMFLVAYHVLQYKQVPIFEVWYK